MSNFRRSTRAPSRKLKKYYPATTSLIRAASRRSFELDPGGALETYAANVLGAPFYYRKGRREIDFVGEGGEVAVEVKRTPSQRDVALLLRLGRGIGAERVVMVSESESGKVGGVQVVPAYALDWAAPGLLK